MKKNILIITFLIIVLFFLLSTAIYANTRNITNRACIYRSTELGGFQSKNEEAMQYAANFYDSKGMNVTSLVDPGSFTLRSNVSRSSYQLYYSHGNVGNIIFKSGGLTVSDNDYTSDERNFYSIKGLDWSYTKLAILCACSSAGNGGASKYSIASKIVDCGAQMTIGWTNDIYTLSSADWIINFHNEMSNGYDVLGAVNRANNEYSYAFPSIRNTMVSYRSLVSLSEDSESVMALSEDNILDQNDICNIQISEVEREIKEKNVNFDVNNYDKQYSDGLYTYCAETGEVKHINSYIDYRLKIGDYVTNSGYTVVVNDNGMVKEVVNHSSDTNNDELSLMRKKSNYIVTEEDKVYYLNKVKENINNKEDILKEEIVFFYDLNKKQKSAVVNLKIKDDILEYKIESYSFNIDN